MFNNLNMALKEVDDFVSSQKDRKFNEAFYLFRRCLNEVGEKYGITGEELCLKWFDYRSRKKEKYDR